ncbi:MAG: glycosyl hydrolase family 8, partial [Pseudomonadota bacterium]
TAEDSDWVRYRERFISAEGRVVDTGNGRISHSEGQGFGLVLARHYGDRSTFARLWTWTRTHLQVREDRLLAWKWVPDSPDNPVPDRNNATDGDLLVAWALCRAGREWQVEDYLIAGRAMAANIRTRLLRDSPRGLLLLPAEQGFVKDQILTLNLSYWVFPAFGELDRCDPSPQWGALRDTGLALLAVARFGRWHLPPNWLTVGETLTPANDFKPLYGYDALRVPLYLSWAGLANAERLKPFLDYWAWFDGARFLPAWTRLDDDSIDSYPAAPGILAIVALARRVAGQPSPALPPLNEGQDYYSASLLLLTRLAAAEGGG